MTLVRQLPVARGVGTPPTEKRHTVPCTVRSIGQQEHYLAKGKGPLPEIRLDLDYADAYAGEDRCVFEGKRYALERTYSPETNGIELILYPEDRIADGYVPPAEDDSEVTTDA